MDTTLHTLRSELELSERKRLMLKHQMLLDSFEPEDNSLWIMLDLITLILVFFVVIYSAPRPNDVPVVTLTAQIQNDAPTLPVQSPTPEFSMDDPITPEPYPSLLPLPPSLPIIERRLRNLMTQTHLSDYKTRLEKDRVSLVIGEKISFDSGKAELLGHIKPALTHLAGILKDERSFRISVSGHTDDTPIHTEQFPSNWELSIGRALSVAKFLMDLGVAPERVSVQGFGEHHPVADNNDPDSRSENRRVEISLIMEGATSD